MDRKSKTLSSSYMEAVTPKGRTGAEGLLEDLKAARADLLSTRHAIYHRIVGILLSLISGPEADDALLKSFERIWRTRSFPTFYERPLLILAALRADALEEGTRHPLYGAIAADDPNAEVVTTEAVATSLDRHRLGVWSIMTTRRVQTNETSRAIAWLWPASLAGCDGGRRPLALFDVGASAGLNLVADQLPRIWTDQTTGKEISCAARVNSVARIGFDSRPLNVQSEDDVLWMRSCIWPGDRERLARLGAGVAAYRAATGSARPTLERLTASLVPDRIDTLASAMPANTFVLAYQTLVTGYLEPTERDNYRRGMLGLVSRQVAGRVLWVELELDDSRRRLPAVLMAHVRSGDRVRSIRMGRSSQHPTEIEVDAAGVTELGRYLAAATRT